jgi:hypothetical protein
MGSDLGDFQVRIVRLDQAQHSDSDERRDSGVTCEDVEQGVGDLRFPGRVVVEP